MKPPDPEYRRLLEQHDWGVILKKTLVFAHVKISERSWPGLKPDPHEVAQQAVAETLDGTRRWGQKCNLLTHVYGAVSSIISNHGKLKDNSAKASALAEESGEEEGEDAQDILDGIDDGQQPIEDLLTMTQDADTLYAKVIDAIDGDEVLEKVFDLMMDGRPAREIAEELELSVTDAYRLTRRLRMKLRPLTREAEKSPRRREA